MKATLISLCINILLGVLLFVSVRQCSHNKSRYLDYKTQYEFRGRIVDSLRNQAAIDCEKRIEKALNRNHTYENDTRRPVKPDFLK